MAPDTCTLFAHKRTAFGIILFTVFATAVYFQGVLKSTTLGPLLQTTGLHSDSGLDDSPNLTKNSNTNKTNVANMNKTNLGLQEYNSSISTPMVFDPMETLSKTLLSQFRKFNAVYPHFRFVGNAPYMEKHDVARIEAQVKSLAYQVKSWTDQGFVFVLITEQYQKLLTEGGSYLYGTVTSTDGIISVCAYEDFFNGTYLVQCPAYSQCVQVDIRSMQIHYRQFQNIMEELNIPLLVAKVCDRDSNIQQKPAQFWHRSNSIWVWHSDVIADSGVEAYCKAVDSLDRLYMIGSSHMRYQYYYLLLTCNDTVKDLHTRVVFVDARYVTDVSLALHDIAKSYRARDCDSRSSIPPFVSNVLTVKSLHGRFPHDELSSKPNIQVFAFRKTLRERHPDREKDLQVNDGMSLPFCRPTGECRIALMMQSASWDLSYIGLNKTLSQFIAKASCSHCRCG